MNPGGPQVSTNGFAFITKSERSKMLGITFPGDREVALMEFQDPAPGPDEVIIEMKASGMCGSDLHTYRRAKGAPTSGMHQFQTGPVIMGHEPCGIVVEVGSNVSPNFTRVGERVMVYHYDGCRSCGSCRSGWIHMCQEVPVRVYGNNDHGGHAKYLKVPAMAVLPLPDEVSFTAGAAISCGTGTAYSALRRLNLRGDQTIAVFGQGPVGLAATQMARAMGARVIALDTNAPRRNLAKGFGADVVLDPANCDVPTAIRELTRGAGADLALDTSGSPAGRLAAVRSLRAWGKVCLVGEGGGLSLEVSTDLLRRQITVMGSWTFSSLIQAECANFVAERGIDVDAIFTDRWRLDQAVEAYQLFDQQSTGKGVFVM
jgi:threonine dehydrogenase-like Zn-dependent dehydrogenase